MPVQGHHQRNQLAELFERGAFKDILSLTVDQGLAVSGSAGLEYIIGALAFLGRIDDALNLYKSRIEDLVQLSEVMAVCRFALGIGLVRVSRYDEGLTYLKDALVASRLAPKNSKERFFGLQGLAFYRVFQCRYQGALLFSRLAWSAAFAANFRYGQTLSADIRGHSYLRCGQVSVGMGSLEEAARLAKAVGNGALLENITSSMAWYRSCYGLDGAASVEDLRLVLRKMNPQDNFSLAAAQVELARQLAMRGRLSEAETYLNAASKVVLVAGHRRQKAGLLHRLAWNRYLMGDFAEAIKFLNDADAELDSRFDYHHLLANTGLRLKIKKTIREGLIAGTPLKDELSDVCEVRTRQVRDLTAKTGSGIGRNILWRDEGEGIPSIPGDDPLGDLCNLIRKKEVDGAASYARIAKVIQSGLLGFLNDLLPTIPGGRTLVLDLIPGELFIFDCGNVARSSESISGLIKTLILQLATGPKTKKELVSLIWGYSYHPLRHDPMLYALVNRLRKALGEQTDFLIADGGGYQWCEGIRLHVYEHEEVDSFRKRKFLKDEGKQTEVALGEYHETQGLNHRQLLILSELKSRSFMSTADCINLFGVSRITATRDLSDLVSASLVKRVGKGRATRYCV